MWGTPVLVDAGLCPPQAGVELLGVKLMQLRGGLHSRDRQTDPASPCEHHKLMIQPGRFEVPWVTRWGLWVQERLAHCPRAPAVFVWKGEKGWVLCPGPCKSKI